MNVAQLHDNIWRLMEDTYPSFTRLFLSLGRPRAMDDSPFAYVYFDKKDGTFTFNLNVDNVSQLSDDDKLFVVIHETFHVLLNHDKLNFPNPLKGNMAMDVVINDYLVNRGIQRMDGLLYGDNVLGYSSYGLSVTEVYELMPDPPQVIAMGVGQLMNGDGSCGAHGDDPDHAQHGQKSTGVSFSEKDFPEFTDFFENQKDEKGSSGKVAGTGHTDLKNWVAENGVTMKWAELLDRLDPNIFKTTGNLGHTVRSWHKLNRKVAWDAPRTLLPVPRQSARNDGDTGNKKPTIVMAIDTSGSITENQRRRFFTLVKSIPLDKVDLACCSFSTKYREFDPAGKFEYYGGGTNFSAIEQYIRDVFTPKFGMYPKAVVVITDGQARFDGIKPEVPGNWYWLLDPGDRWLPANIKGDSLGFDLLNNFTQ